jgi:mRNA-degrading endonuclease toxin of MazEF toxin-antitoxin module
MLCRNQQDRAVRVMCGCVGSSPAALGHLVELTTLSGVTGRCRPLLAAPTAVQSEHNLPYGLPRDSVVNVTALVTVDKDDLDDLIGQVATISCKC